MREFLLVVPDLMAVSGLPRAAGDRATSEGAGRALRFGTAEALPEGWRSWLAARLRRPSAEAHSLAAAVASAQRATGDAVAAQRGAGAWLATPLHLVAGLDTLHLPRDGILSLTLAERAGLVADFASALGAGGLSLHAVEGDSLLLCGPALPPVATLEPSACLGADLVHAQPTGPGAPALRRLMAEIEMWLHGHAVNRRREAAGLPAVRSLWLWGGRALDARGDDASLHASSVRRVHSCDTWTRAIARLAGVELAPQGELPGPEHFGCEGDVVATASLQAAGREDPVDFDRRHLGPAIDALEAGRLDRIRVIAGQRSVAVVASDRYRLWRPRRAWGVALVEGS